MCQNSRPRATVQYSENTPFYAAGFLGRKFFGCHRKGKIEGEEGCRIGYKGREKELGQPILVSSESLSQYLDDVQIKRAEA